MPKVYCSDCDWWYFPRQLKKHLRTRRHIKALFDKEDAKRHPIFGRMTQYTLPNQALADIFFPSIEELEEQVAYHDEKFGMGAASSSSSPSSIKIKIPEKAILLIEDFVGFYKQGIYSFNFLSNYARFFCWLSII